MTTTRKIQYLHKILVMQGAPLALWGDKDNAGPYAICQLHLIHATFGEKLTNVGVNGSDAQKRAYREAKFVWNAVREIVEADDYHNFYALVKTATKTVRKLWPKWSTTVDTKGANGERDFEREAARQTRLKLNLPV